MVFLNFTKLTWEWCRGIQFCYSEFLDDSWNCQIESEVSWLSVIHVMRFNGTELAYGIVMVWDVRQHSLILILQRDCNSSLSILHSSLKVHLESCLLLPNVTWIKRFVNLKSTRLKDLTSVLIYLHLSVGCTYLSSVLVIRSCWNGHRLPLCHSLRTLYPFTHCVPKFGLPRHTKVKKKLFSLAV